MTEEKRTRAKFWVQRLEANHLERAETLIPRLLTQYGGVEPLAKEAGVSIVTVMRWCDAHDIERAIVYRPRKREMA